MKIKRAPLFCSLLLFCLGLLVLFDPIFHLPSEARISSSIPHHYQVIHIIGIVSSPIIGVILIYLSLFTFNRRLLALYISCFLCLLLLVSSLLIYSRPYSNIPIVIIALSYITLGWTHRNEFIVGHNLEGISRNVVIALVVITVATLYGLIGFYAYGASLFHMHVSPESALEMTINGLTGFSGALPDTRSGELFLNILGGMGLTVYIFLLGVLFRPLRLKLWDSEYQNRERAMAIFQKYSTSTEDFFKMWPEDKHYFFAKNGDAFLAYKQGKHAVVILGGPIGKHQDFELLVEEFTHYCYSLGWTVIAINLDSVEKKLFNRQSFNSLPIGREATIDIEQFIQNTLRSKHFRYVNNSFKRDQLIVAEWNEPSDEQIQQLQIISRTWLKQGNRREYTFFMGYFDRSYLQRSRVFVLFQNNEPVAFVNILPSQFRDRQSIDLFRSATETSPVGMYFLFEEMVKKLSSEGAQYLNIGLAPLSNSSGDSSPSHNSALRLLRRFGFYYSFKGVEQFKNKFRPKWETRYIAYSGSPANLLRTVKDVEYVSSYKTRGDRLVYLTTIAGIAVFSIGLYFILN